MTQLFEKLSIILQNVRFLQFQYFNKVSYLDSFEYMLELGADECTARVSRIDVQPDALLVANQTQLLDVVE